MEINFEGSYDLKTVRKKTALVVQSSQKFSIRRIFLAVFLALLLALLVMNIYQSKEYFSRTSFFAAVIVFFIYSIVIQPYIAPYLAVLQASMVPIKAPVRKGTVSSEGIKYLSDEIVETISWNIIYKAKQTDYLIVLFADYSPSMAFPRKFFKNEADWQQFRRWVDFYVNER